MSSDRTYENSYFNVKIVTQQHGERVFVNFMRLSDGSHLDQWSVGRLPEQAEFQDLFDNWVQKKIGAVEPEPTPCVSCGVALRTAIHTDTDYQFDNALWLTFGGSYGMFIDPIDDHGPGLSLKGVLCHDCAHVLCDENPWIRKLLNDDGGHTHYNAPCLENCTTDHSAGYPNAVDHHVIHKLPESLSDGNKIQHIVDTGTWEEVTKRMAKRRHQDRAMLKLVRETEELGLYADDEEPF